MTKLPVTISEKEAAAIDIVAGWIAPIRERWRAESGKQWLENALLHNLREGNSLNFVVKVVEAAEKKDDELADAALREVGAERQIALIQKRDLHGKLANHRLSAARRGAPRAIDASAAGLAYRRRPRRRHLQS